MLFLCVLSYCLFPLLPPYPPTKIVTAYIYVMMMLTLGSALAIAKTDPQFEPDGYLWICVHIISLGEE